MPKTKGQYCLPVPRSFGQWSAQVLKPETLVVVKADETMLRLVNQAFTYRKRTATEDIA